MPFARMMRAKYDTDLAVDVLYRVDGIGEGQPIRAIPSRPDAVVEMDDARIIIGTQVFKVLVEVIAAPKAGDTIEWISRGELFTVQGEPMRYDRHALEWTLDMLSA